MGTLQRPPTGHGIPLFFQPGTGKQVDPTQAAGPHIPGGSSHLALTVGAWASVLALSACLSLSPSWCWALSP